ncbi:MAG: hypothetical protein K9N47_07710 [Prosthecobacter sp.]|uniref:hypothetical protein n=1 Tax=Prosthecobacter sp. TaxID=1965333 RepID=UPI0025F32826|nr:hypothetical protein [Prosthecobacter sp.]MCF7785991.1 hypothetical protein [Prosthecobacter sp.]
MNLPCRQRLRPHGSLLIEVSVTLALTSALALLIMRASLLAISGNQWTIMQTLTDAYLSRESALSNRLPYADLTSVQSAWPNLDTDPAKEQTVTLGRVAGGQVVQGTLKRFRTSEVASNLEAPLTVWRVYSILSYRIGSQEYVKSRSTLRLQ